MLLAVEASIAQSLGGLSSKQKKEAEKAKVALVGVLDNLISTGDREALRQAGEISYGAFEAGLTNRLAGNFAKWQEAWERFSRGGDTNITMLGRKLFEIVEADLKLARGQEDKLWGSIDDVPITSFFNVTRGVDDQGRSVVLSADPTNMPGVLKFFDDKMDNAAWEALSMEDRSKLGTITKIMDEMRIQLGFGPTPVTGMSPQAKRLDTLRKRLAGQDSVQRFDDILSGEAITGRDTRTGTPLLQRGDDGSILPTQENIAALGSIISERAAYPTRRSGATSWKETQDLLAAQKDDLVASLTQSGNLPGSPPIEPITLQQLVKLRGRALAYAREYGAVTGNDGFAGLASRIAQEAKNDIDNFMEFAGDAVADAAIAAWTGANSYSRALNDVFTRGFGAEALTKTRTGALRTEPEVLISGFKQQADLSSARYDQVLAIDDFMRESGFLRETVESAEAALGKGREGPTRYAAGEEVFTGVSGTIRNILKVMVDRSRNEAGELDPKKLQKFVADFSGEGRPLSFFPKLQADLSDLKIADQLFTQTRDRLGGYEECAASMWVSKACPE
jgi:hypothetical protein